MPIQRRFEEILDAVREYNPQSDTSRLSRAYLYSAKAHRTQNRVDGQPYLVHPVEVCGILADLKSDDDTLVAALLHDVLEDSSHMEEGTKSAIQASFGKNVLGIVQGVTKITQSQTADDSRVTQDLKTMQKLILAMVDDPRTILVKLADRLHNMRTLGPMPPDRQIVKAKETEAVFAPIAHRLSLGAMHAELEDLALRYLNPTEFNTLQKALQEKRSYSENFLKQIQGVLEGKFQDYSFPSEIKGRIKHLASIYRKLQRQGIGVEEVYDYMAFRVLVGTVDQCYTILGKIHETWTPIPHRIKDFIAAPKGNGYRSLHTSVVGPKGEFFEVQIRTFAMHKEAEFGIAAHWRYKEGGVARATEEILFADWLKKIREWQDDASGPAEFLDHVAGSLKRSEIFVFTPKGDPKRLPQGATCLDFAYAIHTEVGHKCVGAKVNGRMVPLRTILESGQKIEILTHPSGHPSQDWLKYAHSGGALAKIRRFLRQQASELARVQGQELLDNAMRRAKLSLSLLKDLKVQKHLLQRLGMGDWKSLLAGVGFTRFKSQSIVKMILELQTPSTQDPSAEVTQEDLPNPSVGSLTVAGVDGLFQRLGKCCNPIHGEDVMGFISKGRGVVIHRVNCPNMVKSSHTPERLVPVSWGGPGKTADQAARLLIRCEDRPGITADITKVVADLNANIRGMNADVLQSGEGEFDLKVGVNDINHLQTLMKRLRGIKGVYTVLRRLR